MAPDLEQRCPDSVRTIFISHSETADVRQFIGQYIDSRCLRSSPAVRNMVLAVLADYPGEAPVRLYELNAWLDHTLSRRPFYRASAHLLRLVVSNQHIPAPSDRVGGASTVQ